MIPNGAPPGGRRARIVGVFKETATKEERRRLLARRMAFVLLVLVLMLAAYLYGRSESPAGIAEEDRESVALYLEALETVREDYVDREAVDPKEQAYGAIEGMLDSLGDEGHTRFLSPEESEQSRQGLSDKYVGVGIKLDSEDEQVVVSSPIDDSPAEEAGIESGDILVAVDGESVQGEDLQEIGERVRGPEGTEVDLTLLRDEEEVEFTVERAELETSAASWVLIPDTDVAHLRLSSFSENSAEKLEEAVTEAREAGAESFVLDLRDNSGGSWGRPRTWPRSSCPPGAASTSARTPTGTPRRRTSPTTTSRWRRRWWRW